MLRYTSDDIRVCISQEWAWPLGGLLFVVLAFGLAGYWDQRSAMQEETAYSRAYLEGFKKGEASMIDSAERAWQAAQAEAQHCRTVVAKAGR